MTEPAGEASSISAAGGALLRMTFRASYDNVRDTIAAANESLLPIGLSEEDRHSIQLVLAEALNNVVEHAYEEDEAGDVTLILRYGRAGLLIEVRDRGRAMPGGRPPISDAPSEDTAKVTLPEGGFGWFLIRELARDLIYDRRDGENFLIFRMKVSKPE